MAADAANASARAANERILTVILAPHITEKATNLADQRNQHTFRVVADATKAEVKAAVAQLFDVQVEAVTLANVKGKVKHDSRRRPRRRKNWKKAYVRLAEGATIDLTAVEV